MIQSELTGINSHTLDSILVFTKHTYHWMTALYETYSQVSSVEADGDLIKSLTENITTVVIIDATRVSDDIEILVREVRDRFPVLVILVLSSAPATEHPPLFGAGADDVVDTAIVAEQLLIRLNLLLRQQQKNEALLQQSHRLHALNILSHRFYTVSHPSSLIVDTIDALCSRMDLSGVGIVIDEGNNLHLYAGATKVGDQRRLYESTAPIELYDPFKQVMLSGISLILNDVANHPYFSPIPVIENPRCAMVLPLKHGQQTLGSIGLFSNHKPFTLDDLAIYELLATHFASAYYNVRHQVDREEDIRYKRQQVRALQAFSSVFEIQDVVEKCHDLIAEMNPVGSVVAFIFQTIDDEQHVVVFSADLRKVKLVEILYLQNFLHELTAEFDSALHPVTLHERHLAQSALTDLFLLMGTSEVVLSPISASTLVGGIFVAGKGNQRLNTQDKNLIESIARATAQTVERNTLIEEIQQQKGRLEAVVRSIREAIFFVNEGGRVIFCNPQFTELTGVNPSQVIAKTYNHLFETLAQCTNHPEEAYQQLESTVATLMSADASDEDYPVLELYINKFESSIYIEFMKSISTSNISGWIGLVRTVIPKSSKNESAAKSKLVLEIIENASIPLFEIQKSTMMLPEQYEVLRPRQYMHLLSRLQGQVQEVQSMWKNLLEVYEMEGAGLKLKFDMVYPDELIAEAFKVYRLSKFQREIDFQASPPSVRANLDERYFLRAIANILDFVNYHSQANAPILMRVAAEGQHITITVQEKSLVLADEKIQSIFKVESSAKDTSADYVYRLGMYVSREIIKEHGGELTIESSPGWGLVVRLYVPIAEAIDFVPEKATSISRSSGGSNLSVIMVENVNMNLGKIYDILRFEGHEIFVEQSLKNALLNLSLTQIDLIVLVDENQQNRFPAMIQSIREKTNIPVLLAITAENEHKAFQSLSSGADAYILAPITAEKLLAQMQSVANRKDVTARVTPPIQIGDLHLNFSRRSVYLNNELLDLTGKEYEVLQLLAMNVGQVLTHEQILTKVWGPEYRNDNQYLWVCLSRLRRKLEPKKDSSRYIHTEKGVGYILCEP